MWSLSGPPSRARHARPRDRPGASPGRARISAFLIPDHPSRGRGAWPGPAPLRTPGPCRCAAMRGERPVRTRRRAHVTRRAPEHRCPGKWEPQPDTSEPGCPVQGMVMRGPARTARGASAGRWPPDHGPVWRTAAARLRNTAKSVAPFRRVRVGGAGGGAAQPSPVSERCAGGADAGSSSATWRLLKARPPAVTRAGCGPG